MDYAAFLEQRIHGQPAVIRPIARRLANIARRLDPTEPRPQDSWLLLGPTGVGKTETVKAAAAAIYGDFAEGIENHLVRFDMAEFQQESSLTTLLGDRETQGRLGDAIDHLNSMGGGFLLCDEIEKGHPSFRTLFLSATDEGHITMFNGERKSLAWIVLVMTSNLGAEKVCKLSDSTPHSTVYRSVMGEAQAFFRPEGLARIRLVSVFRRLPADVQRSICSAKADSYLTRTAAPELSRRAGGQPIVIVPPDREVLRAMAKQGYSDRFGARNMRDTVATMMDHALGLFLDSTSSAELSDLALAGEMLRLKVVEASAEDRSAGMQTKELRFERFDPAMEGRLLSIDARSPHGVAEALGWRREGLELHAHEAPVAA